MFLIEETEINNLRKTFKINQQMRGRFPVTCCTMHLLAIETKFYYSRKASQTGVFKHDWLSPCKIIPSGARNSQQLFQVKKFNKTLHETKTGKHEWSNITLLSLLRDLHLFVFDPKQLLRVSCIWLCYFTKWLSITKFFNFIRMVYLIFYTLLVNIHLVTSMLWVVATIKIFSE